MASATALTARDDRLHPRSGAERSPTEYWPEAGRTANTGDRRRKATYVGLVAMDEEGVRRLEVALESIRRELHVANRLQLIRLGSSPSLEDDDRKRLKEIAGELERIDRRWRLRDI